MTQRVHAKRKVTEGPDKWIAAVELIKFNTNLHVRFSQLLFTYISKIKIMVFIRNNQFEK